MSLRKLNDLGNELDGESTDSLRIFYRGLWDAAKNIGRYSLLAGAMASVTLGGCGWGGTKINYGEGPPPGTNRPPGLTKLIPDQKVREGHSFHLDLQNVNNPYIADFDGDRLTVELINGPGEINNDRHYTANQSHPNKRYFYQDQFDADHNDNAYKIEFLIKDGRGGETPAWFMLTQKDTNRPPVISPIQDQTVQEGGQIDLDLNQYISDPENDSLTTRIVSGPGSISNNKYSYTNPLDNNHTDNVHRVEIAVEDGYGGQERRSFKLTQQDINRSPVVQTIPQSVVWEGTTRSPWSVRGYINDPEGDKLTIQLVNGPGQFGGTLGSLSLGDFDYGYYSEFDADAISDIHTVEFLVEDDKGGQTRGSFEVRQNDLTKPSAIKNHQMEEGVVLTSWWYSDYGLMRYDTLDKLYDLGVESIPVLVTWYQNNASSLEIARSGSKTPDDRGLELVLKKLKFIYGMKTKLKPHIDLLDGNWRGDITHSSDADWAKWFQEYTDFIIHYAKIAERNRADYLIIGTELNGTVHRPEWRQVIRDVRAKYPSGKILYSAHWDKYKNVPFWDDLDGMGIGVYFPEPEFAARAQEAKDFAASIGKKLYILEVGCQSRAGAGNTPWWSNGVYDEQEQADYYQTAFDNFYNQCAGMDIWHTPHDLRDLDIFSPIGKLAEQKVRDYYDR